MDIALAIALIAALSAYLTSVACRLVRGRGRKPGLWLGVVGDILAAVVALLFVFQTDVFHPDRWQRGKIDLWLNMTMMLVFSLGVGFIPALVVAGWYRGTSHDAGKEV